MKIMIVPLIAFCIVSNISLKEEGWFIYEYPGYEDTPLIPGSEFRVHQHDRPQPPRVIPSEVDESMRYSLPPSDAIVLFDGTSLDKFEETTWQVVDGILIAGEGNLYTKEAYGSCQLHVEWRTPNPPGGEPANMGNSGIFFMGLYELQIYDSYSCKIYPDGSAGALYGQTPPLVNACRKPGQWQHFDIVFTAPVFANDQLVEPGWMTVLHNGVLVHNHTRILGPTVHRTVEPYKPHTALLPLMIQGHGSPVAFRNIWIRRLE